MKKIKFLVVTAVIVVCLSFSSIAYAVASPTGGTITSNNLPAGVVINTPGTVSTSDTQTITNAVGTNNMSGTMVFLQDLTLSLNGAAYHLNGSATFTINVASVHASDKVTVVHLKSDGSVEFIAAIAGEGTVTFTTSSLSPIGILRTAAASSTDTATKTTAATVSPKTSEADDLSMGWLIVLAAAALTITLVSRNMKKATK